MTHNTEGQVNAYWVNKEEVRRDERKHLLDAVLDLLLRRNTRGVDIVDTWANDVRVAELLECRKELHVALGGLNRDDIGVETLNGGEDVVEVGVAEMRVGLSRVADTCSRKLEGVDGPAEVVIPVNSAERQLFEVESE